MRQKIIKMGFPDTAFCIETYLTVFCYYNLLSSCIELQHRRIIQHDVFCFVSFPLPMIISADMCSPSLLQRSRRKCIFIFLVGILLALFCLIALAMFGLRLTIGLNIDFTV